MNQASLAPEEGADILPPRDRRRSRLVFRTSLHELIGLCLVVALCQHGRAYAARPALYYYPPPVELADGSVISSPLMISVDQMTISFPVVEEMTGVVIALPWSTLCPEQLHCDFGLIDQVLAYWGRRGKKVVLGISTAGPPFKAIVSGQKVLIAETPDWVFRTVASYDGPAHAIGRIGTGPSDIVTVKFPEYWDARFPPLFIHLIHELGRRYDGNPTLSTVRISTGLVGEDAPTPFGVNPAKAPGYTYAKWLRYSQTIRDAYAAAFPHTALEYDISYLPWGYANGDAAEKQLTDAFMHGLERSHLLLAFNGLQPDALVWLQHAEIPGFALNRVMHYLQQHQRRSLPIGVEAVAPIMVPKMQNIAALAHIFRDLHPQRLVLFGLDAGSVNDIRHGPNATNKSAIRWMAGRPQSLEELGKLSIQLLDACQWD